MNFQLRAGIWAAALVLGCAVLFRLYACCSVTHAGSLVLNADQRVIILWDAEAKRQHFVRQASFTTDAKEVGFIVPSPSEPELAESGDDAFKYLASVTSPQVWVRNQGVGCGCSNASPLPAKSASAVEVLQETRVAGFDAVVLRADTGEVLAEWLKENDYPFSPEVAAWAEPYIEQKWRFTALKVAKKEGQDQTSQVSAAALRISFDTDRPLFPYREPEYKNVPELAEKERLLRIYFLADARYDGELTPETPWTGEVEWAGTLRDQDRSTLLTRLGLPANVGPKEWFLTEFADRWPYRMAPADVYFAKSEDQIPKMREPVYVSISSPTDSVALATFGLVLMTPLLLRRRRA